MRIPLLLAALLAAALPVQAEEKALNLYSWSAYIPEQALEGFRKETGILVKYDIFDSSEALDAKLLTGCTAPAWMARASPLLAGVTTS